MLRIASSWFARRAEPTSWPCFGALSIADGDTVVLAVAVDHIAFDGLSAYLSLTELPRLHAGVLAGDPPPGPAPSHVDAVHRSAWEHRDLGQGHPALRLWEEAAPHPAAAPPQGGATAAMSTVSYPLLAGLALDDLGRAVANRARLPFVLLVALEQALRPELPGPYPYLVSTHNRRGAEREESVGWFAGVAPYPATDARLGLLGRAQQLAGRWRDVAAAGALDLPVVAAALDVDVRPRVVVSIVDLTAVEGHETWPATGASTWAGPVAPSDEVHLWLTISPGGLSLEARHQGSPVRHAWTAQVVERCRSALHDLARASTPARKD